MTIREKQTAFLQETIDYYSEDTSRRSSADSCFYDGANVIGCTGDGCAIGRKLSKRLRAKLDKDFTKSHLPSTVDYVFDFLPKNLTELGVNFLKEVQGFHDYNNYWNKDGMADAGKEKVQSIIQKFSLGEISFKN